MAEQQSTEARGSTKKQRTRPASPHNTQPHPPSTDGQAESKAGDAAGDAARWGQMKEAGCSAAQLREAGCPAAQ